MQSVVQGQKEGEGQKEGGEGDLAGKEESRVEAETTLYQNVSRHSAPYAVLLTAASCFAPHAAAATLTAQLL